MERIPKKNYTKEPGKVHSMHHKHLELGYGQLFCVNFSKANSLRKGRFLRTFPIGFDLQCNSILREIKAKRR